MKWANSRLFENLVNGNVRWAILNFPKTRVLRAEVDVWGQGGRERCACICISHWEGYSFCLCFVMMGDYKTSKTNSGYCVKCEPRANGTQDYCAVMLELHNITGKDFPNLNCCHHIKECLGQVTLRLCVLKGQIKRVCSAHSFFPFL